jgi:isopenicillin-N N-acyltransferase-like protein
MARACRLIEISGAPYERGVAYGRQAAPEIRIGVGHYAAQVQRLNLDDSALEAIVAGYLPQIEAFEPRYVEEMRGIAAGADVAFHHVVMINARTEVLKLAASPHLRAGLLDEPDGCTTAVAAPSATADGRLIHAHNWDWKMESAESSVVLRIRNEDGPDILTFTEAGALGRFGFNALGIGITANYLECERDYSQIAVPLALIRRQALEQSHFALALRSAYVTPKSASNNIVLTHSGGGLVFNLECAPDETFQVEPQDGLLVHANHWRSPVALSKLRERGVAAMPDSLYRDRRVRDLLEPKIGALTVADMKAALLDKWGAPWSVCRPTRPSTISNLSATVVTLVMEPAAGVMEVAVLPALDPTFTRYTLEMEASAELHFMAP